MFALLALGAAICFGSADFAGGLAARRAPPLLVVAGVNLVALPLVAVPCLLAAPSLGGDQLLGALVGGLFSAVTLGLIYAAFAAGAMSLAAPLVACGSIFVPTVTATVVGQPPAPLQSAGILFALIGVVTITWPQTAPHGRVSLSRRALTLTGLAALSSGVTLSLLLFALSLMSKPTLVT
ncbi:MAG: EamA family transporter, partial [Solirubrobacterales bacterium]